MDSLGQMEHTAYAMNSPVTRTPNRVDLIQVGKYDHALQRSRHQNAPVSVSLNLELLDQLRFVCRARHYTLRIEDAYVFWMRKFILFQGKVHPLKLAGPQVQASIEFLSVNKQCASSTVRQALLLKASAADW